jgi:hypothetical protein
MLIAHMDVPITRRKRYILVTDESDQVVFRCKYMWQLVAWMDGEGQEVYMIALEGTGPVLEVNRLSAQQEHEKWQS